MTEFLGRLKSYTSYDLSTRQSVVVLSYESNECKNECQGLDKEWDYQRMFESGVRDENDEQ